MAGPWRSFNEIYQDLTTPRERGYGGDTSGLQTTNAAPQTESLPATSTAAAEGQQQTPAYQSTLRYMPEDQARAGAPYTGAGLLAPIYRGAGETRAGIQGAVNEFSQAAGPARSYESTGAEEKVRQGIETGQGLDVARGFANAEYTGPRALKQESIDKLSGGIQALKERAAGLSAGQIGTQAMLQEAVPGLTRGERRFEANLLHQDPKYLQAQQAAIREALGASGLAGQRQTEAESFAKERAAQESDIRQRTQDYLTQQMRARNAALEAEASRQNATSQDIENAYQKFKETGTIEDLAKLVPEATRLQTPTRALVGKAKEAYQAVQDKYQDIKDVPTLELRTNSKGREVLGLPDDWWFDAQKKYSPAELQQIKARAQERQADLEAAGFAGGTGRRFEHENPAEIKSNAAVQRGTGEFRDVAPLYMGEDLGAYELPDLGSYVSLQAGNPATKENVATIEQRDQLNRVHDLMGSTDRLATTDPFRAAKVMAEVDRYLTEEENALAARKGTLDAREEEWAHEVSAARGRYNKNMKKKKFRKVARIIEGVSTLGLSELGGKTPIVGKAVSETQGSGGNLLAGAIK